MHVFWASRIEWNEKKNTHKSKWTASARIETSTVCINFRFDMFNWIKDYFPHLVRFNCVGIDLYIYISCVAMEKGSITHPKSVFLFSVNDIRNELRSYGVNCFTTATQYFINCDVTGSAFEQKKNLGNGLLLFYWTYANENRIVFYWHFIFTFAVTHFFPILPLYHEYRYHTLNKWILNRDSQNDGSVNGREKDSNKFWSRNAIFFPERNI